MTKLCEFCHTYSHDTRRCRFSCSALLLRRAKERRCRKEMARPYKEPPEPMSIRIIFRCTPDLKKKIEDMAAAANLTEGEVIRRKMKGMRIPNREHIYLIDEIGALRQQVSKQGGLIKHLAAEGSGCRDELSAALKEQIVLFRSCTALIERAEKLYRP